jgi:hypothetical protein
MNTLDFKVLLGVVSAPITVEEHILSVFFTEMNRVLNRLYQETG